MPLPYDKKLLDEWAKILLVDFPKYKRQQTKIAGIVLSNPDHFFPPSNFQLDVEKLIRDSIAKQIANAMDDMFRIR